jgi:hypothetical protein
MSAQRTRPPPTLAAAVLAVLAVLAAVACASFPGEDDRTRTVGPDSTAFKTDVNPVFERRCSTLDCHGHVGRPMRLYGANGLRLPNDAGVGPGGGATTQDEIKANYFGIIALEPDKMQEIVKSKGDPLELLLLKKALNLDGAHKGGPAIFRQDDAERCISGWIKGQIASTEWSDACKRAARPF